jgi:hypothetical protein
MSDRETSTSDVVDGSSPSPLEKLTRAQVFARDPEDMTQENLQYVIEEITKINLRNRKARADDAAIAASAAKMKKANAATRKKKAAPTLADNLLDTKL